MKREELEVILEIIDISLKYGVPLVREIIRKSGKAEITIEDIEELKIDKQWEDYFK